MKKERVLQYIGDKLKIEGGWIKINFSELLDAKVDDEPINLGEVADIAGGFVVEIMSRLIASSDNQITFPPQPMAPSFLDISFARSGIGNKDAGKIVTAFAKLGYTLRLKLDMSGNNITDTTAMSQPLLSFLSQDHVTAVNLDLSGNNISDKGCEPIIQALYCGNTSLGKFFHNAYASGSSLNLNENRLSETFVKNTRDSYHCHIGEIQDEYQKPLGEFDNMGAASSELSAAANGAQLAQFPENSLIADVPPHVD